MIRVGRCGMTRTGRGIVWGGMSCFMFVHVCVDMAIGFVVSLSVQRNEHIIKKM